ncbi:MAG: T9SS type A sorting domain-containing protein [Candidatus Poribacteria bacterium]|nr:T9SS type A sorting domain-containing protein [Candidatus Poribacteria bacterium]
MERKLFAVTTIICLIMLGIIAGASAETIDIAGPWLWMIAPVPFNEGGADSIDFDSLNEASSGAVTEEMIADEGANVGDFVGDYQWTPGEISVERPRLFDLFGAGNINDTLNAIGFIEGNVDHATSYALINIESKIDQGATMKVGSDDAIKVWLNGIVVYTDAVNRSSRGYQDTFQVNLHAGDNLLMVKVSEREGKWRMFVGLDVPNPIALKQTTRGQPTPTVHGNTANEYPELTLFNPEEAVKCDKYLKLTLSNPEEAVKCVVYSPQGDVLAAGGNDNHIYLWGGSTGDYLGRLIDENPNEKGIGTDHHGDVNSIAFSPDNKWFASGTQRGYIRVWRRSKRTWAEAGAWTEHHLPLKLDNTVRSVAFSPDSRFLACGTNGDKVHVYRYFSRRAEWRKISTLQAHTHNVSSVAFHPTVPLVLASGNDNGQVLLWEVTTGDVGTPLQIPEPLKEVDSIAFSPDGSRLASGYRDGRVILWRAAGDWLLEKQSQPHSGAVQSLAFDPSGTLLLSGSSDQTIGVLDGHMGSTQFSLGAGRNIGKVSSVTFSPCSNAIAFGTETTSTNVYQLPYEGIADLTKIGAHLKPPDDFISQVAFFGEAAENCEWASPEACTSTYFVLKAQFVEVIGAPFSGVEIRKCTIILDIPGVPTHRVAIPDALNVLNPLNDEDPRRLDTPGYFMFPLISPNTKIKELVGTTVQSLVVQGIGAIPFLGNALAIIGAVETVIQAGEDFYKILESTADPKIVVRSEDAHRILFMIKSRVSRIDFTLVQEFQPKEEEWRTLLNPLKNPLNPQQIPAEWVRNGISPSLGEISDWIDERLVPTFKLRYEGTWDLENGTLAAPRAQLMLLANYPPFQELPPEVQKYLFQHFRGLANPEAWQVPEVTSLLPNYPNPFNPETWIPYQLAKPADVTLTIYDIQGRVVQNLDLGHQRAGMYHRRSRAAHWDGRNALGEPVASGLYFYTLTAGDFSATRKMLIRK